MWTIDDASQIGESAMDGSHSYPSYEAGFDVCDPLGSFLENIERRGRGPARVLRRRCRSEGVDRSPYEHVSAHRSVDTAFRQNHIKSLPNKSHFTLNTLMETSFNLYHNECSLAAVENGDYVMAHNTRRHQSYHTGRTKHKTNQLQPNLTDTLTHSKIEDNRLPKVEDLLEKDFEMMETPAKQPLKSILNNPMPKSPLHGILKKPKNRSYQETKEPYNCTEGRRRQRASSESDNLYCSFQLANPIPRTEGRLTANVKRSKESLSTGYSYGSAIAAVNSSPRSKSPLSSLPKRMNLRDQNGSRFQTLKEEYHPNVHILRTTAINNETADEDPVKMDHSGEPVATNVPAQLVSHPYAPPPSTPAQVPNPNPAPAAEPDVRTVPSTPVTKKGTKKKLKSPVRKKKIVEDPEHASPTPITGNELWNMDAEALISEINKIEGADNIQPQAQTGKPDSSPKKKKEEAQKHPQNNSVTKLPVQPPTGVPSPVKKASKEKIAPTAASHTFYTALNTSNPFKTEAVAIRKQNAPLHIPATVTSCVRPSLFPRVPPYLKFINHDEVPCLKIPLAIQKHLKWKLTTITPIVVKKTLTNSGFRLVKSECDTSECPQEETLDWVGIWGKHMKSIMFRAIKDGQKMNHFPGTFQIGRKDRLWRNLQKLVVRHGIAEFGIMPTTYVLPHDMKLLKHDWEKHQENNEKWIIKPPASARGTGIKVVSRWSQIPKKRSVVVQRYVSNPYLINGSKFDMRLYVLVTSVHPLRIYLYKDGLARFASVKYNNEITSLNDRFMHLTNYSINKLSKNYTPNEDFAACEGHKWTLQTLFNYLREEREVDTDALWEAMKDLVIKTIISGEASISSLTKTNVTSRYNCYELFGVDVLLDEDLKPWLLEVNISPSLHSASPLDIHVKGPLVTTVLNIAQFQVPTKTNLEALTKEKPHKLGGLPYDPRLYTVYLSKEERDKHIIYTNMEERDMYLSDIISTLTPDDVRHLIQAEDELTQAGDMERVFPTHDTHKYLNFLAGPRYYNRLFDAWETRYSERRETGIELLKNLCEIGYHLEVPPVPLKNDVDAPSPAASEQPSVHSIPSPEQTPSAASLSAAPRTCGDVLPPPSLPPPLEPRA